MGRGLFSIACGLFSMARGHLSISHGLFYKQYPTLILICFTLLQKRLKQRAL